MNRQTARRRIRKRKAPGQKSKVKFGAFLGIMVLAVFLGFLTARFVVGPLIGYDADESPARLAEEKNTGEKEKEKKTETEASTSGIKEEKESESAVPESGFALQVGAFSTREAAETMAASLSQQGITTEIIKADDVFKVISPVMDTKEKALDALEKLEEKEVEDVFVASFE